MKCSPIDHLMLVLCDSFAVNIMCGFPYTICATELGETGYSLTCFPLGLYISTDNTDIGQELFTLQNLNQEA